MEEQEKLPHYEDHMSDNEMTEGFANRALSLLLDNDYITSDDLPGIRVEYGYLYVFEGHGPEALFSVAVKDDKYYFAVQGDKLMALDLNDELFEAYTKEMHKRYKPQ